jgi:hypothetical protein
LVANIRAVRAAAKFAALFVNSGDNVYLLPNPAPVNNRKWNLGRMGRMGCGCSARGIATPPTKRMGGLGRMGAVPGVDPIYTITPDRTIVQYADGTLVDVTNGNVYDSSGNLVTTLSGSDLKSVAAQISAYTQPIASATPAAPSTVTPPSTSTTTSNVTQTPSNFLNSGSVLTYSVQWASSLLNVANPSQILATIKPILSQQWGIEIDSSSIPSTIVGQALGFTITVHTTKPYGKAEDIKAIIDGAIGNAGRQVTASQIVLGAAASSGFDISSFISAYALPIGLGVGALLLVKEL